MTMQEWPDDKLDEFFRKASEELNPQLEPDDWNRMKRRLNQEDRHVDIWSRFKSLFIILGVLTLVTGIWFFSKDEPELMNKMNDNSARTVENSPLQELTITGELNEKETISSGQYSVLEPVKKGIAILPKQQLKSEEGKIRKSPAVSLDEVINKGKLKEEYLNKQAGNDSRVLENNKILSRHSSDAGGVHSDSIRNQGAERDGGTTLNEMGSLGSAPISRPDQPTTLNDPFFEPEVSNNMVNVDMDTVVFGKQTIFDRDWTVAREGISQSDSQENESVKETPIQPRLGIRAGLAPEFNAVTFPDFSFLSMAAKVLIEYRLMPRTYVQVGIVKSSKTYCAFPGDYSWPDRWKQPLLPASVDGTCDILEMPLNIRYNIIEREKLNWVVTGGISNYRMLNEKYTYNYERPDPAIKWYEWEGNTGWYWASHLNLSAGMERKLGKRFSVFAEPYLKVPVKKVGLGKINLYSTGIWFSVKYNLH